MTDFSSYLAKSCDFGRNEYQRGLSDNDLSSHMGTETLLAHDQVPGALPASNKGPTEQQVHHIESRYLIIEKSANNHHNSKVSKGLHKRRLRSETPLRSNYTVKMISLPAMNSVNIRTASSATPLRGFIRLRCERRVVCCSV
jgi:hypothetical protein